MAGNGGSRRGGVPRGRAGRPARPAGGARRGASAKPAPRAAAVPPAQPSDDGAPRVFTLGAVPGATPGTWISRWRERMPHVELVLRSIPAARQREELVSAAVDAAIVRLPIDDADLHVIPLYDEVTGVVVPVDSHLTAADELDLADLAGEIVITPGDDVLALTIPETRAPAFDPPADTGDAVETVAAGVGVVVVPMSLARLHARKDVAFRPLRDAPRSRVALAWARERATADVDVFVGIVRGRTANSSR